MSLQSTLVDFLVIGPGVLTPGGYVGSRVVGNFARFVKAGT